MIEGQLTPEIAAMGIALGLLFSLVCYLVTNLSPGGMITPGWLALTLVEDARRAAMVVAVTLLTYLGTLVLQRLVILYGKRLFAAVVMLSVLLQLTVFLIIQRDFPLLFSHQTLGFVAPGLVAYQLIRQPKGATVLATSVVSGLTYGVVVSGILTGLVPVT
jgi:gamma-polyglutamate biosynthesis protein CapC